MPKDLREHWAEGLCAHGGWIQMPGVRPVEMMARGGFDYLTIDMQHGLIARSDLVPMMAVATRVGIPTLVRVPWNDPSHIGFALDNGAAGIIIPMVETGAEAAAAVRAALYAPAGMRSFGPARGPRDPARANRETIVIPMVETRTALDHLDEILETPGVDAVYIGPADLSISLGLPPALFQEGEFESAIDRVAERCAHHGVIAGIHASAELAARHRVGGYRLITIASDALLLSQGAAAAMDTAAGEPEV